jgi:precorrin-2 dehydrogenase/sirohydrochlorin ferrochelatase
MLYYPIFLDMNNQKVLVVGGGTVAERKIQNLLRYGCQIYIVSPHLTPRLNQLVAEKKIYYLSHEAPGKALDEAFMVIAATDDPEINSQIASQAKERGLLINAVDQPGDCNFIMPSIVQRGDLQIAISTAGKSPALAKRIRKEMEVTFGPEYASLIELLGLLRIRLLAQENLSSENRVMFEKLVNSNLLELIKKANVHGVKNTLESILGEDFPVDDILKQVFKGM